MFAGLNRLLCARICAFYFIVSISLPMTAPFQTVTADEAIGHVSRTSVSCTKPGRGADRAIVRGVTATPRLQVHRSRLRTRSTADANRIPSAGRTASRSLPAALSLRSRTLEKDVVVLRI